MIVDNDCVEVTSAIVSQLRNVLPSAPKEYVHPSVCLLLYIIVPYNEIRYFRRA